MTSKEHHKHAKIARPAYGNYSRNEWAILGTSCDVIQRLANDIANALSPEYKLAYLDATHKEEQYEEQTNIHIKYTSHPLREDVQYNKKFSPFKFREAFNEADLALVNGNHLKAKAQVVIIDKVKRASLEKRMEQLTDVQLILLSEGETEVFDFIKQSLPRFQEIPVLPLSDREKIIAFFREKMAAATPVLNALVLAGGQSMRMGHDKTAIDWHGKQQRYFVADLLRPFANEVFISCRSVQQGNVDSNYKTIVDSFTDLGPYGAILSAFRYNPDAAWLVIASDLPLLDHTTLEHLVHHRNRACVATTFTGADGQPEPLITIWEPKSYLLLLAQLAQGYSCPRKLLLNNDIHLLTAPDPVALMNVNTPEQAAEAKHLLEMKLSKA